MRKNFLIGNFLQAYGSSFGRIKGNRGVLPALSGEDLKKRFDRRTTDRRNRRTRYILLLQTGLVASLSASILVFKLDVRVGDSKNISLAAQETVQLEEIVQTKHEQEPPPPPRPRVPVVVPDEIVLEDDDFEFDALLDLNEALALMPPPPPDTTAVEIEPEIFIAVESMPELVGGVRALSAEVNYPSYALRAGISGTVVIQIVVGEDGVAHDPKVLKGVHESLDLEAIRAVLNQKFIPGKQRGRAVPVYMNIPVKYRIR
jgi:protein TonB